MTAYRLWLTILNDEIISGAQKLRVAAIVCTNSIVVIRTGELANLGVRLVHIVASATMKIEADRKAAIMEASV